MTQNFNLVNFKEIEHSMIQTVNNGLNVHDHLKSFSVEELREINQIDRLPFHVMALSLSGDLNIGTIIRSSLLHGAEKVWVYGRRKTDTRGTVGAMNYLDVERVYGFENKGNDLRFDLEGFNRICEENNLYPVFVEQGGHELGKFDWTTLPLNGKKILLVMGNETNGIPDEFLTRNEATTVSIPQRGVIRSFNVSSAMAIVAWDMRVGLQWV